MTYPRTPGDQLASEGSSRHAIAMISMGIVTAIVVLILGVIAKSGPLARFDLRVDKHIALHDRNGTLTTLAKAASEAATPETVGIGLLIVIPVALWLLRRRIAAVQALCLFGGAFVLAELGKKVISEHRPPAGLWAMAADSGASYPSGHATIAAALAIVVALFVVPLAWRNLAIVVGVAYAVIVAVSRVYLADHYPADVIGSMLCAIAAGLIVVGLAELPAVRPYLARLERGRRGERLPDSGQPETTRASGIRPGGKRRRGSAPET